MEKEALGRKFTLAVGKPRVKEQDTAPRRTAKSNNQPFSLLTCISLRLCAFARDLLRVRRDSRKGAKAQRKLQAALFPWPSWRFRGTTWQPSWRIARLKRRNAGWPELHIWHWRLRIRKCLSAQAEAASGGNRMQGSPGIHCPRRLLKYSAHWLVRCVPFISRGCRVHLSWLIDRAMANRSGSSASG